MASSYGTNTTHRPPPTTTTITTPPSSASQSDDYSKDSSGTRRIRNNFKLIFPFNIPLTPEAAAVRTIRNLAYFGLYYVVFMWSILFISLIPKRKLSLILLVATTAVTCLYLLLLRLQPNSAVLHRIIDKRLVLALLGIVTMVEMILTRAAVHFFVTLAASTPIVLVHAIFRVRDDLFANEEDSAAGELVPLVYKKSGTPAQPSDDDAV